MWTCCLCVVFCSNVFEKGLFILYRWATFFDLPTKWMAKSLPMYYTYIYIWTYSVFKYIHIYIYTRIDLQSIYTKRGLYFLTVFKPSTRKICPHYVFIYLLRMITISHSEGWLVEKNTRMDLSLSWKGYPPWKETARTWTNWVGRWNVFLGWLPIRAQAVSFRECTNPYIFIN